MSYTPTPTAYEIARELESLRAARNVATANRDRLGAQLHTATADAARVRALVKSGDVAACELAKPQLAEANLRAIIAELDADLRALDARIENLETAQAQATELESLRADVRALDAEAVAYHRAVAEACAALEKIEPEIRAHLSEWNRRRREFRARASAIHYCDPDAALSFGAESAERLLKTIGADGTGVENVWGALPHNRPFSGGHLPVSGTDLSSGWARAVIEFIAENRAVAIR